MEQLDKADLSNNILEQLDRIEKVSNKKVNILTDYKDHDTLTLDQASHQINGEQIDVIVTNKEYRDFVLTHELYHIELEFSNQPKIENQVTSGKPDVDGRIISTADSILESMSHAIIVKKQKEDGSFNEEIQKKYLEGIEQALNPNVEIDPANLKFFRTLIIFDGIIFGEHKMDDKWKNDFPASFKTAQSFVKKIEDNDLTSPFQFRRTLINILDGYNDLIITSGYEGMHYHEFLNITPIVSKRQLRLNLNQIYQIKHSAFKNRQTGLDAFDLITINDGQSAATLDINADKVTPEFYQKYYQQTVQETFEKNNVNYLIR